MPAVPDTSPVILLAKVGRLDLLSTLYGEILVPPAVVRELHGKGSGLSQALSEFLASVPVRSPSDDELLDRLSALVGPGEAEAVVLASQIPGVLLIMDDYAGRRVARTLGLPVTGLLGVLVEAKGRGLLPSVAPILDRLIGEGFWVSDAMRKAVLASVGE